MITVRGIILLARLGRPAKGQGTYSKEAGGGGGSDTIGTPGMCGTCVHVVAMHCTFTSWLRLHCLTYDRLSIIKLAKVTSLGYIVIRMAKGSLSSN